MRLSAITLIPRSQKQAFPRKIAPRYAPQAANSHTAAEQCTPRRPNGGCRQNAASRADGSVFLNPNSSQILRIDNSLSIVDRSSIFLFTMLSFEALVDMRDKW